MLGLRFCPSHVATSYLFASVGLMTLMLTNNMIQSKEDIKYESYFRGGRLLEHPYDMLNKWVVLLRRYDPPSPLPVPGDNKMLGFMSVGYGLYYREGGWMLANIDGVLQGAKEMQEDRLNASGLLIHDKLQNHTRTDYVGNRIYIQPYRLILDHTITFPGPNVAVFRAYLDNYEEVFRVPPYGQPSWTIVYPLKTWLPDVASETDQRTSCYVFIHDLFVDTIVGPSKPPQWRFWPIKRKGPCDGPICKFEEYIERNDPYEEYTISNQYGQAGQICDDLQDRGAPILCHKKDKEWDDDSYPSLSDGQLDRDWKLAYTVIAPVMKKSFWKDRACSRTFTAFNLAWSRKMLFESRLGDFIPDHYKPYLNPKE